MRKASKVNLYFHEIKNKKRLILLQILPDKETLYYIGDIEKS